MRHFPPIDGRPHAAVGGRDAATEGLVSRTTIVMSLTR